YRLDPPVFVVSGPFLSYFILPPPRSTLFPYTTLFRSTAERRAAGHAEDVGDGQARKDKRHGLRAPVRRYEVCRNDGGDAEEGRIDRKSTRLNSSHVKISYAVFCLKKKRRSTHSRSGSR